MRALAGCLLLPLALGGCARKLPGPAECRAFALTALGVSPETPAYLLQQRPALAGRAEELTRTCLTKPWDYELLGCLQRGGSQYICMSRFEQRRLLPSQRVQ